MVFLKNFILNLKKGIFFNTEPYGKLFISKLKIKIEILILKKYLLDKN